MESNLVFDWDLQFKMYPRNYFQIIEKCIHKLENHSVFNA